MACGRDEKSNNIGYFNRKILFEEDTKCQKRAEKGQNERLVQSEERRSGDIEIGQFP